MKRQMLGTISIRLTFLFKTDGISIGNCMPTQKPISDRRLLSRYLCNLFQLYSQRSRPVHWHSSWLCVPRQGPSPRASPTVQVPTVQVGEAASRILAAILRWLILPTGAARRPRPPSLPPTRHRPIFSLASHQAPLQTIAHPCARAARRRRESQLGGDQSMVTLVPQRSHRPVSRPTSCQ